LEDKVRSTLHATRPGIISVLALSATIALAACSTAATSSGNSNTASGGLPKTIQVVSVTPLTGVAGFAGISQLQGAQVAVAEINSSHYLGSSELQLSSEDTAGNAQTAASEVTQAASNPQVVAVLGSVLGSDSVATSPIAMSSKLPIVYTESGGSGVILGDYTYRASPTLDVLEPTALAYVQSQALTRMAVIYLPSQPTYQGAVQTTLPGLASKYGYQITATAGVSATTTDFSAPVQRALAGKPDVVELLLIGAQNASAVTLLRQDGYNGLIIAQAGIGGGVLTPTGAAGKDVVWPTTYTPGEATGVPAKFTEEYKAKFGGKIPLLYAADGYDAMWMIARAIKAAGSADRTAIARGLATVAAAGFAGAEGDDKFVDNSLQTPGVLVTWNTSNQTEELMK
jgi:branched-chain amino acid transport system substrate-binding protein